MPGDKALHSQAVGLNYAVTPLVKFRAENLHLRMGQHIIDGSAHTLIVPDFRVEIWHHPLQLAVVKHDADAFTP